MRQVHAACGLTAVQGHGPAWYLGLVILLLGSGCSAHRADSSL